MQSINDLLREGIKEVKGLKAPLLPVGIFLVATLSYVVAKDRTLSSWIKPCLEDLSTFIQINPDCIYAFLCFFLLPILFLLVVRENPRNYGLSFGRIKPAIPVLVCLLTGLTLLGFFVSRMDSFRQFYPYYLRPAQDLLLLFLNGFVYMWSWEFINRGFLLLGLKRYVGVYAVYIQLIPFVILHLGKPPFELYGSILFGLFFGFYAYLTDSFIYGAVAHATFAFVAKVFMGAGG